MIKKDYQRGLFLRAITTATAKPMRRFFVLRVQIDSHNGQPPERSSSNSGASEIFRRRMPLCRNFPTKVGL